MKFLIPSLLLLSIVACTKKDGTQLNNTISTNTAVIPNCDVQSNSIVTYSGKIKNILNTNCLPCHSHPGSGGIDLDALAPSKATAQSGQLMPVVIYSPGNIFMPPSPQRSLDSCEIKALNLWIKQGCLP